MTTKKKGEFLESYIVNIYRREGESNTVVGLVEKVGSEAKQAFQTWEGMLAVLGAEGGRDRRREGRLRLTIPATVEGVSADGGSFRERTAIGDISPHGARLSLMNKPDVGAAVLLVLDPDNQAFEKTARVMRRVELAEKYEIGVSF